METVWHVVLIEKLSNKRNVKRKLKEFFQTKSGKNSPVFINVDHTLS